MYVFLLSLFFYCVVLMEKPVWEICRIPSTNYSDAFAINFKICSGSHEVKQRLRNIIPLLICALSLLVSTIMC